MSNYEKNEYEKGDTVVVTRGNSNDMTYIKLVGSRLEKREDKLGGS